MTRVLVVQLCRLGDILQTTPMLRGLRRMHPDAHITLMVLDGFRHAPIPGRLYDELSVFPLDRLAASTEADWRGAIGEVRAFVAGLGEQPYDVVLNLTGSTLANLLCALLPSREVRGGLVARDRTRIVRHPWMTYFWSSLVARSYGAVNLVDLFRWVAEVPIDSGGLEIEVPSEAHGSADRWLRVRGWSGAPLVALQLGASDERKRWPPEQFAAMADLLPESAGPLVFVGAASERPLVERALARLRRPALNAVGETSVVELAALLTRARLLVTNDTGTMHVATAMGTRVLDLSTGPVFVHETGPYAVGAIAVEPSIGCFPCAAGSVCHHLSCRDDFTPADIAALAMFALEGGTVPQPPRARVLRAARAATGRLEFRPLWDPAGDPHGAHRRVIARMWEATLPVPAAIDGAGGTDDVIAGVDGEVDHILPALGGFAGRADRAAATARAIARASAGEQGVRAAELERELEHALTSAVIEPLLQPIAAYLRTRLESTTERDVSALARVYQQEWAGAAARARFLAAALSRDKVGSARS
jgi:ADP-heptose:LPS heptosyltransferase